MSTLGFYRIQVNLGQPRGYIKAGVTTLSTPHLVAESLISSGGRRPCDLLDRLRSGEKSALSELTQRFGQDITRIAYLQLGDRQLAEDIAQETLLAAWDAAKRTKLETAIWPWLLGIAYNRCRKHWRSVTRRRKRDRIATELRLHRIDDVQASVCADRLEEVRIALAKLNAGQRMVVILRFFEGMSIRESATALKIPEGTVKRRCHVAIKRLREQLGETLGEVSA